jgi:Uma2 family endonuclease
MVFSSSHIIPKVSPILQDIIHSPQLPKLVAELDAFLKVEKQKRNDFYEWLRDDVKAEFIDGEVVMHSPVVMKHNTVSQNLATLLRACVFKQNLGFVGIEKILVKLTRNDFEPDVCFFGKEKAKAFNDKTMFFPAPDFVVEILSKSTEKNDRGIKMYDYAAHDVAEYWIIDPEKETIEQYQNNNGVFELQLKVIDGSITSIAIPNFEIPVKAVFNEQEMRHALKAFL